MTSPRTDVVVLQPVEQPRPAIDPSALEPLLEDDPTRNPFLALVDGFEGRVGYGEHEFARDTAKLIFRAEQRGSCRTQEHLAPAFG